MKKCPKKAFKYRFNPSFCQKNPIKRKILHIKLYDNDPQKDVSMT